MLLVICQYDLGSGEYNFNLFDTFNIKVAHYKTWVNRCFKTNVWFYQYFLNSVLDVTESHSRNINNFLTWPAETRVCFTLFLPGWVIIKLFFLFCFDTRQITISSPEGFL